MAEFAESFRKQIEDAFRDLINDRKDSLYQPRVHGVSGLADWIFTELPKEIKTALDQGDPDSMHFACARMGLAALMLRDASEMLHKSLQDAYDGPACERDAKIKAAMLAHSSPKPKKKRKAPEALPSSVDTSNLKPSDLMEPPK